MNIELLEKIKAAILAKPEAFDMSDWFQPAESSPCGTSACLAGWAITLGAAHSDQPSEGDQYFNISEFRHYSNVARELLDLPEDFASDHLFYSSNWPYPFDDRYHEARDTNNPQEAARVAAERIDHLIATGE